MRRQQHSRRKYGTYKSKAPSRRASKAKRWRFKLPRWAELRPLLRFAGKWTTVAAIWSGLLLAGILAWFAHDLPRIDEVVAFKRRPAITLVAADGTQIARYGDFHGVAVNVADVPDHLIHAILATEDRRFYSHFGVDPIGLLRAVVVNMTAGRTVQGGSTITQQLAKNLFLSPERTLKRKVQEAMLAIWLEQKFTKNQILTAYLNRVYLGAGAYGIDAAARTYFDKPATDVNLREAAVLAGLLKAPSRYAPSTNPDKAAERSAVVLQAMVDAGYITEADILALGKTPPVPRRKPSIGDEARYFADWIADQVGSYAGYEVQDLTVITTLDPKLQRAAERRVDEMLEANSLKSRVSQAALVSLAPDGAIRAMVGGRTYQASQFNRATQALRQPGSSFKPIVFLAGLEAGLEPDSTVEDAPIRIGKWQPSNFDNEFRGPMTVRDALAYSANTAAVRVLDQAGVEGARAMARRLGITAPLGKDMSIALGTSEVTLLELTGAYAGFANLGQGIWPYGITEIRDRGGRVLYQRQPPGNARVVDGEAVAKLNRMMMGVLEYGTGRGAKLDRPAAGKTGTSQDYRDAWFVGFTADLVTGVWMGNDNNSTMKRVTGGGLPARLWHDYMMDAHAGLPVRSLPGTDGLEIGTSIASRQESRGDSPLEGLLGRIIGNKKVKYTYPSND